MQLENLGKLQTKEDKILVNFENDPEHILDFIIVLMDSNQSIDAKTCIIEVEKQSGMI